MSTILIIEDEDRIASFVAKGLKAAGFTSHRTASGVEGATLAAHGNFDLVILDVGLPDIDGFEVLERIRGQGVNVPVIISGGYAEPADLARADAAGASGVAIADALHWDRSTLPAIKRQAHDQGLEVRL